MPIIIAIILLSVTISADAGFRMFGPGGQYVDASESPEERAEREKREASYRARTKEIEQQRAAAAPPIQKRLPKKYSEQDAHTNMSGVEWLQRRGSYDGVGSSVTRREGYRAGRYRLEFKNRGRSNFWVWLNSRRGLRKLIVNEIGREDGTYNITLDYDDEIYFEVRSSGTWALTMERTN